MNAQRREECKPVFVEWGMFGWLVRMPNGSAARSNKESHHARYFSTGQQAQLWLNRQRVLWAGTITGASERWTICS